jgi:hypothetical protein
MKSPSSVDLIKSCDSLDPNFRYVEGQSQCGLNDLLQQKPTTDSLSSAIQNSKYRFSLVKKKPILFVNIRRNNNDDY